jgi:hypothetical protein
MRLTDQQIRNTVAQMAQDAAGMSAGRERLLKLALAGDASARFVVHTHFTRQQNVPQPHSRFDAWLTQNGAK